MQRPSQPELVGVILLGISLLTLSLYLRQAQPGQLPLPVYVGPAVAALAYVIASFALIGVTVRVLILFAAMLGAHAVYAFIMGCGFGLIRGQTGGALGALTEGLIAYPPAVLLQMAFVVPAVGLLLAPRLRGDTGPVAEWLADLEAAQSPEELAAALAAMEIPENVLPEQALEAIVEKARALAPVEEPEAAPEVTEPAEPQPAEPEPVEPQPSEPAQAEGNDNAAEA